MELCNVHFIDSGIAPGSRSSL